jgi:hypothetical protein
MSVNLTYTESIHAEICAAVDKLNLPKSIRFSEGDFSGLGAKHWKLAVRLLDEMTEKYGTGIETLSAAALRATCHALIHGVKVDSHLFDSLGIPESERGQECSTPQGYGDVYGLAWILATGFEYAGVTGNWESDDGKPLLACMSLFWMREASNASLAGNLQLAMNWAYEAQDAYNLMCQFETGADLEKTNRDDYLGQLSDANRKSLDLRHANSRQLREWAKENGSKQRGSPTERARNLMKTVPNFLTQGLKDPQRIMREAIGKAISEGKYR